MRSTQQLSITLPNEMAELVRAKVAAGEKGIAVKAEDRWPLRRYLDATEKEELSQ